MTAELSGRRGGSAVEASIAIVDAREWQNIFDLRTGAKIDATGPIVEMTKDVLRDHPYPGDMDPASNRWVTEVALNLVGKYDPQFVFLSYAQQYFSSRYAPMTGKMRAATIEAAFAEADRFINETGFTPIMVGTGDMTPLVGMIDASRLDGLTISSHWSARYAGLYGPSARDLDFLFQHPFVERVVPRNEVVNLFDGTAEQAQRVPQYLLIATEGHTFKVMGSTLRKPLMIPSAGFYIPVSTDLGNVKTIEGIRGLLERNLKERKIALIVLEGVGVKAFTRSYFPCENGKAWFYYEPGEALYLTITTGEHRPFDYPTGYKYYEENTEQKEFPLSGYFRSIPEGTFAAGFPGKSIAVGNKSMFMHMVTGADICVECFARNLYNQGTMAVIHRQDKW
ncbi:MAG: hypothetical protein A4E57_03600 [Syntrophorhabdaceae bacterium PtaU1.Bin034]|nr:MAG: hypothetical protein A4E57_03600 [Syntrophorhabdaceae bacterium PtaU1.Bin034]